MHDAAQSSYRTSDLDANAKASEQNTSSTTMNPHPNAGLLVEPEIMGLPRLRRGFQPQFEVLQN